MDRDPLFSIARDGERGAIELNFAGRAAGSSLLDLIVPFRIQDSIGLYVVATGGEETVVSAVKKAD